MEDKYFLTQIKHTNGTWEKGVVVKDSLNDARQSYHAYLGAYGYGKDANTDYVQCVIRDTAGRQWDAIVDDRRTAPESEQEESNE